MEEKGFVVDKTKGVIFDDKNFIPFYKINYYLLYNNILIIIGYTESGRSKIDNDNVYGIDIVKKKITWQIKNPRSKVYEIKTLSGSSLDMGDCHFTDMNVYENKLWIRSICNFGVIIDELTGEIKEIHQLNEFK
ncbi:MAG TPA: hypothetical protein VK559_10330 [Ferruginibacter sp.]|nr:hypothetical protein [Ferruginibacter sp.]